jgi:selenide,water dikinase
MRKVDSAKRRRIMQRSQKLGHCVCDPRRPCPCDVFKDQGICPCAGERPEPLDLSQVRLTELVHNAGCASKIAPADLDAVLSRLPAVVDPSVVSGVAAGDDAGIYRLAEGLHLVQTVDVMTPCCDDPEAFGRICAANCLSDIYAMGGVPRTALSILAFPSETLDGQIMYRMMKGAMEVLAEANVALIGGHSIKDEEIKLGFAITGTIDASLAVPHDEVRVGDLLVLTKPLGVGVLNFARQVGREVDLSAAVASMTALNKPAAEAMTAAGASACTDVTGFGLFGHLIRLLRASGATAEIVAAALPALPGALEALREGVIPGAVERNTEYVGGDIRVEPGVEEAFVHLGFDAQTSGGLLISVPPQRHALLRRELEARGASGATIGRITGKSGGQIHVVAKESKIAARCAAQPNEEPDMAKKEGEPKGHSSECCADVFGSPSAGTAEAASQAFAAMMKATGAGGAIDARTKELLSFTLAVSTRCAPCVAFHLAQAKKMGISQAELDEAAWLAVAMCGAPVRMFYLDAMKAASKGCCS